MTMKNTRVREYNVRGSYANGYNKNVYTRRYSVRPKLSGFGADGDVQYTPPAGYSTSSLTQVTAGNQEQLAMDGPDVSDNRFPAEAVAIPGEAIRYAPPVGWWVAIIESANKSSVIWIAPTGQTYAIDDLDTNAGSANMTPRGTPSDTAVPSDTGIGLGTVALAVGAGYIIYKLFTKKSKSTTPRAARVRS